MMTDQSSKLFEKSKKIVPGGVHSPVRSFKGMPMAPRFMEKAQGAFIYDVDGKDYIDFCMSFGPLILGHKNPQVHEAMIKAMEKGWTYGSCEPYSLELAEFITDKIAAVEQIRFMNSGTEAVMTAIRLARGYTAKEKIIKFEGCYHGHLDAMLIKAGSGLAGQGEASSQGVTRQTSSNTLVCGLGDIDQLQACFDQNHNEVAAIIMEPLPANFGILPQGQDYLKQVAELCKKHQSLLIFDEVISGFRVAFGGMSEKTGIQPDIITYGKIVGGGLPVGAIGGKKHILEHLAPVGGVYQAGTLSANPLAMTAGLATLRQLAQNNFYEKLEQQTQRICQIWQEWFDGFNNGEFHDFTTQQFSSLFWPIASQGKFICKPSDFPDNANDRFIKLFCETLKRGIYLAPNGYEIGFVSAAHDEAILNELHRRLWA